MQHKIKRNRDIYRYRRGRSAALKVVALIVASGLLVFLGWSIAPPIIQMMRGELKPRPSASSAAVSSHASSARSSSKATSAANTANAVRGITLPVADLSNTAALTTAAQSAKKAGFNLALIDLKSEDGMLQYASKLPDATSGGLCVTNAPDASAAASAIKNAGLTPAARICCFLDSSTSSVMRQAAVLYSPSQGSRFRDNNGNFWLNPYNDEAQQYLINVACEAVADGFKTVVLDDVEFPSSGNPGYMYFGATSVSKEQQLLNFVAKAKQSVNAAGGTLLVRFQTPSAVDLASTLTGQDQNMYALSANAVAPDFMPSELSKTGAQIGTKAIQTPDLAPSDTVAAIAQYAASKTTSPAKVVPIIQAYTNTSLGEGYYKQYTTADISAELAAVKAAGFSSYILYNPQGTYDFTGLASSK